MIIDGKVNQRTADNHHINANYPILFYAGQSVHIPNRVEIERDMGILCSEEEINYIFKKNQIKYLFQTLENIV